MRLWSIQFIDPTSPWLRARIAARTREDAAAYLSSAIDIPVNVGSAFSGVQARHTGTICQFIGEMPVEPGVKELIQRQAA